MADVLIVGLGPGGAAAAIRLAQAGLRVVAVDRAVFPREKTCSEFMSPQTVRQLDLIGVLPEVLRHAVPLYGTQVFGPRGSSLTGLFAKVAGVPPEPRVFPSPAASSMPFWSMPPGGRGSTSSNAPRWLT